MNDFELTVFCIHNGSICFKESLNIFFIKTSMIINGGTCFKKIYRENKNGYVQWSYLVKGQGSHFLLKTKQYFMHSHCC